jgi:hypothetical protein
MIFISVDLPDPFGPDDRDLGVGIELQIDVVQTGLGAPGKVLVMFFMTKLYCAAMAALVSERLSEGISGLT